MITVAVHKRKRFLEDKKTEGEGKKELVLLTAKQEQIGGGKLFSQVLTHLVRVGVQRTKRGSCESKKGEALADKNDHTAAFILVIR